MKQKILLLTLAIMAICWSPVSMAQQADQRCIDTDEPLIQENHRDYLLPGVTKGNIIRGRDAGRYSTRKDSCTADGKLMEFYCSGANNDVIYSRRVDCGRMFRGYACQNGRCAPPQQEEIVLDRCGEPILSNNHYVISRPIVFNEDDPCFLIRNDRNITIECRGNGSVTSLSTTRAEGFRIDNSDFINIVNCPIERFKITISTSGDSDNIRILGNTISTGQVMSPAIVLNGASNLIISANVIQTHSNGASTITLNHGISDQHASFTISNNTVCDSGEDNYSLQCFPLLEGDIVQGSGNLFQRIGCSDPIQISPNFYQPCP